MTERQRLEIELEANNTVLDFLGKQIIKYQEHREQLTMKLNRARRLEQEELQNAKQQS